MGQNTNTNDKQLGLDFYPTESPLVKAVFSELGGEEKIPMSTKVKQQLEQAEKNHAVIRAAKNFYSNYGENTGT
ncbi:MAG: hypothetical protein M1320_01865 [Patescibacteria group bacterium]|nr:hypothetical protein [Patescibacteria group bacterium]